MGKISFVLLLLFSQFFFSQNIPREREVIRGRIIADSMEVAEITIFNVSSNIGAISDVDGRFSITAKAKDTLYFQGLSFVSQKYVLTEKDFWTEELEIRLKVKINELDEVVVTPYTLTGDLEVDTKKIKTYGGFSGIDMNVTKNYGDERFNKGNKITTSPDHFAPNGSNIDFLAIGRGIGRLLGIKKNSKKNASLVFEERRLRDIQSKSFAEHINERFSHHFFISTLKIKNEEIVPFLAYAEMSSYDLVEFLKVENELKLIEYLIDKSKAFKKENEELLHLSDEK